MSHSFTLLVFDWDGTLMDSEARIVDCFRQAILDVGVDAPVTEAIRNIIGLGLAEAVRALFPAAGQTLVDAVCGRYRHHFLDENRTPSELFARTEETLRELAHRNYLLAVATGKSRRGLDRVLTATGLGELFHATRCADETFSKPHPQMLMQLMDELGVEPADTLMIGDTEYDMQMARNAGTAALAVSYGVHAPERLWQHAPLGCLDDIGELNDWLDGATRRTARHA